MIKQVSLLIGMVCLASPQPGESAPQRLKFYQPKIGQPHADFVLPNIETGEPISLSQYRGKKVLLIHFASW